MGPVSPYFIYVDIIGYCYVELVGIASGAGIRAIVAVELWEIVIRYAHRLYHALVCVSRCIVEPDEIGKITKVVIQSNVSKPETT